MKRKKEINKNKREERKEQKMNKNDIWNKTTENEIK